MIQEVSEYKQFVKLRHKVISKRIGRNKVVIKMIAYFDNAKKYKIGPTRLYVGDDNYIDCKLEECSGVMSFGKRMGQIKTFTFDTSQLLKNEAVNNKVAFRTTIEGEEIEYRIIENQHYKNKRYKYLPEKVLYHDGCAIFFRHTAISTLVLVKRKMEEIEHTGFFRFIESKPISAILYLAGKISKQLTHKKKNIYYEKFSSKAEEGTFELFQLAQENSRTNNYFVIDEKSADYQRLKDVKNVIRKYSLKYYWSLYTATAFISTEIPDSHVNVFRMSDRFLKKAIYDAVFVFLQHGVTYMKRQGKTSSFVKNRSGEPDYMVVGSQKEKRICMEMLQLEEECFLVTGLPIYALTEYKHINQNSDDYVMVMLTWRPYEENLSDFSKSDYYSYAVGIVGMLERYIDSDRILLVGHPKVNEALERSGIKTGLWDKPISEAIEKAKLLITDYSSVCYNAFYQGAGVIFFQPDLEKYEMEVGELIPADNEYIGQRVFEMNELEKIVEQTIQDGHINLAAVRSQEFEGRHLTINEFTDGRNIERIYQALCNRNIL